MFNALVVDLALKVGTFASNVAAILLVLVIGWFVAMAIKSLVVNILQNDIVQVDAWTEKVGVDKILAKGGIKYSVSELIAILCYWAVILIALVLALSLVNVNTQILEPIISYIPKVISAVVILVLGIFAASFVNSLVQTTAANAGIDQSSLLAKLSQITILIFTIAIAFEQLEIGTQIINFVVSIILGSFGLAIALAFGLGCKDIAARSTQEFLDKIKSKK